MITEKLARILSISNEQAELILEDKLMPTPEQQKILAAEFNVDEDYISSLCR